MNARNLLLIVIDQFRADLLSGPLAAHVPLPNIRKLASESLSFERHHTVTVPCGPSRASLLTSQYAMNHRSVFNGSPLSDRIPNLATALRDAGRELLLFGYTDTQLDPVGRSANDPAHRSYTHPIPGITEVVEMREEAWAWLAYLKAKGYDVPDAGTPEFGRLYRPQTGALGGPALYRAEDSDTAYLTDQTLAQLDVRKAHPWAAMLTYIRPHPPFVAPAPWHALVDPEALPPPLEAEFTHPFFDAYQSGPSSEEMFWGFDGRHETLNEHQIKLCRATYLCLAAEVDHHIGRVLDWLEASGQSDDTLVVLTADHGEMLGDFGLWGKRAPFTAASHIPLLVRHPDVTPGQQTTLTESIDLAPTLLSAVGAKIPSQMQGRDLLQTTSPEDDAAMVEMDLGSINGTGVFESFWNCTTEDCRAVAFEQGNYRLVHFASGHRPLLFDLRDGPDCLVDKATSEPDRTQRMLAQLLSHRMRYAG